MFEDRAGFGPADPGADFNSWGCLMAVSVHDVAAILRDRLPALPVKKLHKLLYYCQGHHLAAFGEPLFAEAISAREGGPVVDELWEREKVSAPQPAGARLSPEALSTVGYVIRRYGALTTADLENLTHGEGPWRGGHLIRRAGGSGRIELEWLSSYFRHEGAPASDDEGPPRGPAPRGVRGVPAGRRPEEEASGGEGAGDVEGPRVLSPARAG
jgi:uncharacterized phage-associated protein